MDKVLFSLKVPFKTSQDDRLEYESSLVEDKYAKALEEHAKGIAKEMDDRFIEDLKSNGV